MDLQELMQINEGYKAARILQTAVVLGIFDSLANGPQLPEVVSESLSLDCRAATILLDALAALKILSKENGFYKNTEVANQYLVSNSSVFYGALVHHTATGWENWGKLAEIVQSGQSLPQDRAYQDDPHDTKRFIMAMHGLASAGNYPLMVVDALDLGGVKTLLDVGGGPGSFTLEFCRHLPELQATILDLPGTLEVTKQVLSKQPEIKNRVKIIPADFTTDPIPGMYDLIFVSNIIHSFSEEENQALLKKLAAVTNCNGRIVIKDHIMSEDGLSPQYGAVFSVQMLIHTRGRDYTLHEVKSWLAATGFSSISHVPLPAITSASLVIGNKMC